MEAGATYDPGDTIAAIATAPGGAARGIVRVSGPRAIPIVERCVDLTDPGRLAGAKLPSVLTGRIRCAPPAPCDLFVWPTHRSYTRQPVVELHTLGSPPIVAGVLAAVCAAGARLAQPGEFTLRAFLAGRIDLTQAEAVLAVIDARGQNELAASLAQLAGGLARPLHHLRGELLQLLAELEAGLDFVEDDIEFISAAELAERLEHVRAQLQAVAEQMSSRLTSSPADQVVLVGPPNVGKSSLFNALVERYGAQSSESGYRAHQALVSPNRGTTRDYLTAGLTLPGGIRCELVDTAGIDDCPNGPIDAAAQSFASQRRAAGTTRVWCIEATNPTTPPVDCDLVVLTKADLPPAPLRAPIEQLTVARTIDTSSRTGNGLDELVSALGRLLARPSASQAGSVIAATAERCRESVVEAEIALRRAAALVPAGRGEELVAAEVRHALAHLGKVVGAVYTDDLLDRIFSTFCVGK